RHPLGTNMPKQASSMCWFLYPYLVDVALVLPPVINLRFASDPGPPSSLLPPLISSLIRMSMDKYPLRQNYPSCH
ncbi:hypothetical protein K443DRAFT_677091, partial [Laccaria amethystina LaAM-08-1]